MMKRWIDIREWRVLVLILVGFLVLPVCARADDDGQTEDQSDKRNPCMTWEQAQHHVLPFLYEHVAFGDDGISTALPPGPTPGDNNPKADYGEDDASGTGKFSLGVNGDGSPKSDKFSMKGAVGFSACTPFNSVITPYVRIDDVKNATPVDGSGGSLYQVKPVEKQYEIGVVYRMNIDNVIDPFPNFYEWFYVQPLYLDDELRRSREVALDFRWVPTYQQLKNWHIGINRYWQPVDVDGDADKVAKKNKWGQVMLIADMRLQTAHFIKEGKSLAAPMSDKAGEATYFPNKDYVRLGGRIGAAWKVTPAMNGKSPIKISAYYTDFTALKGVKKGLGEAVVSVDVPVAKTYAISLSYKNGRTEHVAAREKTLMLSLTLH